MWPIVTLPLGAERDVVVARQQTRYLAELLGLEEGDQVRVATAVSEIARNAFSHGGGGRIALLLDSTSQMLVVQVADRGPGIADGDAAVAGGGAGRGLGLAGARRLMDRFELRQTPGGGLTVELGKRLPAGGSFARANLAGVADALRSRRGEVVEHAAVEQNRSLLQSLQELQDRQLELQRVNEELADTNRGVVALYAELEDAAEQVRRASESKSRFLSSITHEFRTPLNSILALSRLLLDRLDGELTAEQAKQIELIRSSAANLSQLVDDLLDLAKVEAGKLEVRVAPFTVGDLFRSLRAALKPLNTVAGVELVFETAEDAVHLHSDEGKVAQVLRNFISNALKFTEHGEVRVTAGRDARDGRFVFRVRDTGIGIDAKHHERIFEEFVQVANPLQRRARGTGLGLPLSRRLAELLGGEVGVESEAGRGSTFWLALPAAAAPGERSRRLDGERLKVLVIDDDPAFRYVIARGLRMARASVVLEREDGAAGLAAARSEAPDVIFLDLNMPVQDGWSTLERLAGEDGLRAIPVVVLTSLPLEAHARRRLAHAHVVLGKDELSPEMLEGMLLSLFPRHAGRSVE